jgi:hypothetical protein
MMAIESPRNSTASVASVARGSAPSAVSSKNAITVWWNGARKIGGTRSPTMSQIARMNRIDASRIARFRRAVMRAPRPSARASATDI